MGRGLKIFLGVFTGLAVTATGIGLYANRIIKRIGYSYGKPKIESNGLLKPLKVTIPLTITNNNKVTLEVTGFKGKLYAGRRDVLASLKIDKGLRLAQGETGTVNFIANIRLADLAGEIVDILESGEFMPDAYILGKMDTNLIKIPVYYKLNYNAGVGELPVAGTGELKKVSRRALKNA